MIEQQPQADYRQDPSLGSRDMDGGHDDPRGDPSAGGAFQSPGLDLGFSTVDLPHQAHQYNLLGNQTTLDLLGFSGDSLSASEQAARASGSDV